jgi:hypothetical protein
LPFSQPFHSYGLRYRLKFRLGFQKHGGRGLSQPLLLGVWLDGLFRSRNRRLRKRHPVGWFWLHIFP